MYWDTNVKQMSMWWKAAKIEEKDMFPLKVFIDTNIWESQRYDPDSRFLKQLTKFAQNNQLMLITTKITEEEIAKNLLKLVDQQATKFNSIINNRDFRIVKEYTSVKLLDAKELAEAKMAALEKFKKECNTEILDPYLISPEKIFRAYFNKDRPFHNKDKSKEFPDAFVLETLLDFAREQACKVHIICNDSDFTLNVADKECLVSHKDIPTFISSLSKSLEISQNSDKIQSYLEAGSEQLISELVDELDSYVTFENPENYEAEFEVPQYSSHELKDFSLTNFYKEDDIEILEVVATYTAFFEITFTYPDFDTASYDSEDGIYIFHHHYTAIAQKEIELDIKYILSVLENNDFEVQNSELISIDGKLVSENDARILSHYLTISSEDVHEMYEKDPSGPDDN